MLLSDRDLRKALDGYPGRPSALSLMVDPLHSEAIQPASIDLRLGQYVKVLKKYSTYIVLSEKDTYPKGMLVDISGYVMHPGDFLLAATLERVTLGTGLSARIEGKSSLGRLGLLVHATAGFIDPGFDGVVTLEMFNVGPAPIQLEREMWITQMSVSLLSSPAVSPYRGKYQGDDGPRESQYWRNYDR